MGHFARVLDGVVQEVIVAKQEYIDNFVASEPGDWIKCSYNTFGGVHMNADTRLPDDSKPALRKNFPSAGWNYDLARDAFIPPAVYDSWVLNEESCLWEAPIAKPAEDGVKRMWNEAELRWEEMPEDDNWINGFKG
jgi:hypothetical protein